MPLVHTPTLVRRPPQSALRPRWDAVGQAVLAHRAGAIRILGAPGTGKTTLLAEVAADRIRRGADPENVLVLTASRKAAALLRSAITRSLTADDLDEVRTVREPLVRTVHSYAFGVLRRQAVRHELPPPRLLSGPEQDAVIRELLVGDIDIGADYWPNHLRAALSLPSFADELRDLLLRAAERGVGPERLIQLGQQHDQPEWVAAGIFGRQYEQVTLLRSSVGAQPAQALDAAELVSSALLALRSDPATLVAERNRVQYLFVDDAQHLDPLQYALIRQLADSATEFMIFGDPDQGIFTFRGADPRQFLRPLPHDGQTVTLTVDHRMSTAVRNAVGRIQSRLPGSGPQRTLIGRADEPPGAVQVRVFASEAQEANWVADQLRRAHLIEQVPWSEMAVVVRSTASTLPVLRRALLAAGVPVNVPADHTPLPRQNSVWPFLTLLRVAARPETLDQDTAAALITGPIGGGDQLSLRALRRGLRRLELAAGGDRSSGELLVHALQTDDKLVGLDDAAEPARRVASLLRLARVGLENNFGIEQLLWDLWQASELEQRWLKYSERGGALGAQADRDLDAIVALFDAAARYVDRLPGSATTDFVDYLSSQQFSGDTLAPAAPIGEAVSVLTAHAAAGREWTVVAVPGVQEGIWPDLRLRGSLLGVERLIDVLAGISGSNHISMLAPIVADERKLLLVAASRAKETLLVSAVRGEEQRPSRFLDELTDIGDDNHADARPIFKPERGLSLAELVGELRQAVCDPESPTERRTRAAIQLARLAEAGVPGAHPDNWYGVTNISTDAPLWTLEEKVPISPSTVEVLTRCPLRWMVERHGGQDPAELTSITGSLVHTLVQAIAHGADESTLRNMMDQAWARVDAGAPWFSRKERRRVEKMVNSFRSWLAHTRGELTSVAVEHELTVDIPAKQGGPWLRLRGRVDRLDADQEGKPVVVDVKTARTPVSKKEAQQHPQLAVYQLAAALGAFSSLGLDPKPGGARLLYVAKEDQKSGAAQRIQPPLEEAETQLWLDTLHKIGKSCLGPQFSATENSDCSRCAARACCPIQTSGRQVSQ